MTAPAGQLSARERIELLLDPGSFFALGKGSSGVITGGGTIDGRPVCLFSWDRTVGRGPARDDNVGRSEEKIVAIIDLALKTGCPLIGIHEGDGTADPSGYGKVFRRSAHASGVIPQLSLIVGSVTGTGALAPSLTDFVVMVEPTSQLFVSGPEVTRTVTGEDFSSGELGGARMHATVSGTAHYLAADDEDAIGCLQDLLAYLPQNNLEDPPGYDVDGELGASEADQALDRLIPDAPAQPYDVHDVITAVLDDGEFCEVQSLWASNIVIGYGRIDGRSVGVVANQPLRFAGCLDIAAAAKAARFIRTCDAFNTPVVTFVDAPGFVPGTDQEWNGIGRHGATLSYAYAEATVPLVTVITRQARGGAYDVMGSKQLGADINLAWPGAQIAVPGGIEDPTNVLADPQLAAEQGHLDAVIRPHETRSEITRALRLLRTKRETLPPKKHGNIPL